MHKTEFTVLGAGGFIGSHLVRHLRSLGYQCHTPPREVDWIKVPTLGHVVYAVGVTADFRKRPLETVEAHVCLLRRLIQKGNFDSLTYLSSTRVYSGSVSTTEDARLLVNPGEINDLYNLSKLMGESLCIHSGRPLMKVARISNVVGLRNDDDMFIYQLLADGLRNGKVRFQSKMESKKDYISIRDAVELIVRIALAPHSGTYNVASGEGTENKEIARLLTANLGYEVSVAPDAQGWEFSRIDTTKTKSKFGLVPGKFSDYFPEFLESYKKSKGL